MNSANLRRARTQIALGPALRQAGPRYEIAGVSLEGRAGGAGFCLWDESAVGVNLIVAGVSGQGVGSQRIAADSRAAVLDDAGSDPVGNAASRKSSVVPGADGVPRQLRACGLPLGAGVRAGRTRSTAAADAPREWTVLALKRCGRPSWTIPGNSPSDQHAAAQPFCHSSSDETYRPG